MPIDDEALQEVSFAANNPRNKYFNMLKIVDRVMAEACNSFERDILHFILARTYGFGKEQERITEKHFLEGVYSRDGECLRPRVAMGKTCLYKSLANLERNRMILRMPGSVSNAPIYMINASWDFDNVSKGSRVSRLNRPKPRNESVKRTNESVKRTNRFVSRTGSKITTDLNFGFKPSVAAPTESRDYIESHTIESPKDRVLATLSRVTTVSAAARTKAIAKNNTHSIGKVWEDAWKRCYPDDPYFTPTLTSELVPLRRALQRGVPIPMQMEFIGWVVENYLSVIKQKLPYHIKVGTTPVIAIIVKNVHAFYSSFVDDKDPNRKLLRRIEEAKQNPLTIVANQPTVPSQVSNAGPGDSNERGPRILKKPKFKRAVQEIIYNRQTKSEQFGEWGDD